MAVLEEAGRQARLRVTTTHGGVGLVGTPETSLAVGSYKVTYRVVGR